MRKPIRFRHLFTFVALAACSWASAQNVGINTSPGVPPTPNADAILDLDVTGLAGSVAQPKRGMLIPRMTEAQRLAIPVIANDNGLLVYQTDTGTVNVPTGKRGFWYYSSVAPAGWIQLAVARTGWYTTGNAVGSVIAPYPEHLGTANLSINKNLVFRTVLAPANPAMQFGYALFDYESGFVGLGTPAPAVERLEVQGAIHMEKIGAPANGIATPAEGIIRYGTKDGLASSATNLNWHWGTNVDTVGLGAIQWSRLENAESLITPPQNYLKDTVQCVGALGDAYRGNLSPGPVTMPTATNPLNYYSPFATNFNPLAQGSYRVQYLYRESELKEAGLCLPATINGFAFYCLEQENLGDGTPANPATQISGEVRMGAATGVLDNTSAAFAVSPGAPFMDDVVRASAARYSFSTLTVSPGWVNFTLATPLTLPAGKNLIIDIVWTRNIATGVGPKVELEDPGYLATKWVYYPGGAPSPVARALLDDNPVLPSGSAIGPGPNAHSKRPVTRFTGTVVSPTTVVRQANYIQYDGGLMVGASTWASGNFRGPGTIGAQKGIYDGSTLLSDHVFDRYFDGAPRPEEAQASKGYAYVGLDQLRERLERDRHLPNMPSRSTWEATGGASLGTITTGLWESVEDQALYITQLEKDLSALEEMAFGNHLAPQEVKRLIAEVQGSKRLSEAQKLHLIDALNEKAQPGTPKP